MIDPRVVQAPGDCLRVGDCTVHVASREVVRADGTAVRITVKSLAVLLALAASPGRVVARDALLDSVWAGTMPTDDVVTQAIAALRKALGDDRDAPTYVETIPKAGYRLLTAVEWLADAPAHGARDAAQAAAARGRGRWRASMPWIAAAAVVLVAAAAWTVFHRSGVGAGDPAAGAKLSTGELPYLLLTSRPGPETQPALSPDGSLVAYAMPPGGPTDEPAIFVQAVQPTPPRQLTTPPPGDSDHLPRWSPDGRRLMFARISANGACALHVMPATGGDSRVVGRCERIEGRYDWLPDGSGIVAGVAAGSGTAAATSLAILRLDSGQWQPMAYTVATGDADFDPHVSPDGRLLAFRRNLSHSDLWVMPAAGGTPRRLTRLRANIAGWDWAPDGRSLLFATIGNRSSLYRHDIASGRTAPLGHLDALALDVAAHRGAMVFVVDTGLTAIYRYALPLREGASGQQVFASTGNDLLAAPSPDGQWLAFHSDRSREPRLWLGQPDHPERLRMIDGLMPVSRHPPQWSADGRRLLVVGEAGGAPGIPESRLYEVDAASGRATPLALDGAPNFAQYLPGERVLVVVDRGAGRLSLRILDAASTPWRVLAQLDDVGEARFDPAGGRVHFVRSNGPGLWAVGLDLRDPVLVDPQRPAAYWLRRWAVYDGRPFALPTAFPACLADWRWLGPAPSPPAEGCVDVARRGVPSLAPVVSADGKWLYASMVPGPEDSDIGLIDLDALPGGSAPSR